jgi:RNA polymerase sigma-70 factor (ECF subfamily)
MSSVFPQFNTDERDAADLALMRRVVLGDGAALGVLMRVHWRGLVGYATHLLDDSEAAQDAVQQAFARLWETRAAWKPSGSVRAYIHRQVRNGAIDELRRRAVRSLWSTRDELRPRAPVTPLDVTEENQLQEALRDALRSLPPKRREVLVLSHLQGLSYKEIGELLAISSGTVKKHVSLALSDLRRSLAPHLPDSYRTDRQSERPASVSEAPG